MEFLSLFFVVVLCSLVQFSFIFWKYESVQQITHCATCASLRIIAVTCRLILLSGRTLGPVNLFFKLFIASHKVAKLNIVAAGEVCSHSESAV